DLNDQKHIVRARKGQGVEIVPRLDERQIRLIITQDGSRVPARTTRFAGSELLVIEPELVTWDAAIESYPIILQSDSPWNVSATISTPKGFIADVSTLTASLDNSSVALQFTLTDTATEFTPMGLSYKLTHKRTTVSYSSQVESVLDRLGSPHALSVLECGVTVTTSRRGSKVYSLSLAVGAKAGLRVMAVDISSISSLKLLGEMLWDGTKYTARFTLKRRPTQVLMVSSDWGYATCSP
ncbi:MAG: hypothetical protein L0177_18350, partial [Chloroflexi bacterium]|nr:hypothetical protein [Chloroflexota bacterium]